MGQVYLLNRQLSGTNSENLAGVFMDIKPESRNSINVYEFFFKFLALGNFHVACMLQVFRNHGISS